MELHAENKSDREHIPHERTSAVADERKGDPGDWKQLNRHADVFNDVKSDHGDDSRTNVCAERVF